jgi:hypothetical protein
MLNLYRTINLKQNKTFQDLILSNKLDLSDKKLKMTSLKLETEFILESTESDKFINLGNGNNAKNQNNQDVK